MRNLREAFEEARQKHGSAKTSLDQIARTFNVVKDWKPNSRNLDIGGGKYDKATNFMQTKGVENLVFDPFNRSADWNRKVALAIQEGGADTVTVNNVLNVIQEDEIIENIVLQAAHALKPEGVAYFLTYEGDKKGVGRITKQTKGDEVDWSWQRHQLTQEYIPFIEKYFQEVKIKNKVIIAKYPYENAQDSNWYLNGTIDDDSENNLMHVRYNKVKENKKIMKKNTIRLTESQFHSLIKESVKRVLKESYYQSDDVECYLYVDVQFPEDLGGELVEDVCLIANVTCNPEEAATYDYPGCSASYDINDVEVDAESCDFSLSEEQIDYINQEWIEENWDEVSEKAEEAAIREIEGVYDARQGAYEDYCEMQRDMERERDDY